MFLAEQLEPVRRQVALKDAALKQWPMALTHARQAAEMAARLAPAGDVLRTTTEQKLADLERQTGGNKSR